MQSWPFSMRTTHKTILRVPHGSRPHGHDRCELGPWTYGQPSYEKVAVERAYTMVGERGSVALQTRLQSVPWLHGVVVLMIVMVSANPGGHCSNQNK